MILAEFFIPHGHCYLWKPELVGLHIVSDALTALAYYSIPLMLTYFVAKRRDVPFNWIFLLFGAFIISCGTTHIMEIWTLWHPNYWLSGLLKAFTAVVSLYAASKLVSLLPQALAMPSAAQFEAVKNEVKERQRAEAALQQQLAAIEAAMDGIAIVNSAQEYIYLNQAHAKLYGYDSSTQLLGKTWRELYYPDEIRRLEQDIFPILSRQGHWHGETIGKRQDGSTYCQEVSLTLMADGGLICVCRDISDRKKTQERLRLLESVVVNANDAVIVAEAEPIDSPGPRIIYVNEAFIRMTGYTPEEVIGKTPRILQGAKTDRQQLDKIRTALETWQPIRAELINYRKDGSQFWVELEIVPVPDEKGWFTHWVSVQRDITDRTYATVTSTGAATPCCVPETRPNT